MVKATQIKILFLLFAYSAVLFHSTIPHCHTNDAHSIDGRVATLKHTCDDHHHDEEESHSHEHHVCHIESLHGDYLKSEIDYTLHADFSSAEILQLVVFALFQIENDNATTRPESATLVRSCYLTSPILRGPPVTLIG